VWDRARDPRGADSYRLHLEVQRRLADARTARALGFSESNEAQKITVRAMLERAHAETSPDVRLRFDLGHIYALLAREDPALYRKAAVVLTAALAMAPDHPGAEEAWSELANVCGHYGDHACEQRAYHTLLRLLTEEGDRGTSTLNLAETEMHLGNLPDSIELYREALRIASRYPSRTLAPLAMWGLAVALDRSGDRTGADKQALAVLELQQSSGLSGLLRIPDVVFFYPDYELGWYDGVGASALARKAASPAEAARHWKAAEDAFASYIRGAERAATLARALAPADAPAPALAPAPGPDRWLELAKVRLTAITKERVAAERRRGKAPPPPPLEDDETTL
jgi:tetratricopeptide (TPR) repeat protein